MKKRVFGIILVISLMFTSFGQIDLEIDKGVIKKTAYWGDSYLVSVYKSYKLLELYKYDKSGQKKWSKEIEINGAGVKETSVFNEESEYAYVVRMSRFDGGKVSKEYFLQVYQIDKSGNIKEFKLKYGGAFECLGVNPKKINLQYIVGTKNGFSFVVNQKGIGETSYLYSINHKMEVNKKEMKFPWEAREWTFKRMSNLKFSYENDTLCVTRIIKKGLNVEFITKQFDLLTLNQTSDVVNVLKRKNDLVGRCSFSDFSKKGETIVLYYAKYSDPVSYKLGSNYELLLSKGRLILYYQKYKDEKKLGYDWPNGLEYCNLNLEKGGDVVEVKEINFKRANDRLVFFGTVLFDDQVSYSVQYRNYGWYSSINGAEEQEISKKNNFGSVGTLAKSLGFEGFEENEGVKISFLTTYKNEYLFLQTISDTNVRIHTRLTK